MKTVNLFFGFCGALLGVGVRFKSIFWIYWFRLSSMVLEVQPYLFCIPAPFRVSFAFLGPLGCFEFWLWSSVQKFYGEVLMKSINFGFGSTAQTFSFNLVPFGPYSPFMSPSRLMFGNFGTIFWGWGQVHIWDLLINTINFGFGS